MRNTMAEKIILKPNDMMVQLMFGRGDSGFDFDDEIKAKARALNKHDREETGREGDGDKTEQTGAAAAQESSIGDEVGGSSGKKARNVKKREKKKEKKNKGKNQEEGEGSDGNDDEAESEAGKENETAPAGGDKEAEWETE